MKRENLGYIRDERQRPEPIAFKIPPELKSHPKVKLGFELRGYGQSRQERRILSDRQRIARLEQTLKQRREQLSRKQAKHARLSAQKGLRGGIYRTFGFKKRRGHPSWCGCPFCRGAGKSVKHPSLRRRGP